MESHKSHVPNHQPAIAFPHHDLRNLPYVSVPSSTRSKAAPQCTQVEGVAAIETIETAPVLASHL